MASLAGAGTLVQRSDAFFQYLGRWLEGLAPLDLRSIAPDPRRVGLVSVDLVVGFATQGRLASPRIAAIVPAVTQLMRALYAWGVRDMALIHDTHAPDALEFRQFGPHCIVHTEESQAVSEIAALPFFSELPVFPKNSCSTAIETAFPAWVEARPNVDTFVVVGDCTDICVYDLATYLRRQADARGEERTVVVPANCVETYDLPVDVARSLGATPHPGDLLHALFLYHMALNGVLVVSQVTGDG